MPDSTSTADATLHSYRESIDNIDAALVFMLAATGMPAADPGREAAQIARLRALAKSANLDPEFSEKFLRFIIQEVIRHHQASGAAG